jgi:ATP-binding cassette subfamily B protein
MGMSPQRWSHFVKATDSSPKVSRQLLMRVLDYAKPYRVQIIGMLIVILITAGLGLISPLILRELIDKTLPEKDLDKLVLLSIALLLVPIGSGGFR